MPSLATASTALPWWRSRDWWPIAASQLAGVSIGLISVRLATQFVPADIYGAYGLAQAGAALGGSVAFAGLVRHAAVHGAGSRTRGAYLAWCLRHATLPAVVSLALLAIYWLTVGRDGGLIVAPAIVGAVAVATLIGGLTLVPHQVLQRSRAYARDCGLTVTNSSLRSFLPLLVAAASGATLTALVGGLAAAGVLSVCIGFGWALPKTDPRPTGTSAGDAPTSVRSYHLSFLAGGGLAWIAAYLNRGIGAHLWSGDELGWFVLAGNLAVVLPNVWSAICWQFVFPRAGEAFRHGDHRAGERWLQRGLVLFVAGALVLGAMLPHVLPALAGTLIDAAYTPALAFVPPQYAYGCALAALHFASGRLLLRDRPARSFAVTATGVVTLGTLCIGAAALDTSTYLRALVWSPWIAGGVAWLTSLALTPRSTATPPSSPTLSVS